MTSPTDGDTEESASTRPSAATPVQRAGDDMFRLAPSAVRSRHLTFVLLTVLAVSGALTSCSSGTRAAPGQQDGSPVPTTAGAPTTGTRCDAVQVPAHEGVDVLATGVDCTTARKIVGGAAGLGRAGYQVDGYACSPSDAPDGDTFYVCDSAAGARITFRYGTAT